MNRIPIKLIEIEPKFLLPLKEYKEQIKAELLASAAEDDITLAEDQLNTIMQYEVNYYMEMQQKIAHNELLSKIIEDELLHEWAERLAKRISDDAINYYRCICQPITLAIINRKFNKQWKFRFPDIGLSTFLRILCENSIIKFEMLTTKSGGFVLLPSMLRRLEGNSNYSEFRFDQAVARETYPPLTSELLLAYL